MFGRLLWRSFHRNWRRKALLVATVAVGSLLATTVLNLSLDVGDKLSRELKRYGANIVVRPVAAGGGAGAPRPLLTEADLGKIKSTFWGNNILAAAPFLGSSVQVTTPGAPTAATEAVPVLGTWFDQPMPTPDGEPLITGVRHVKDWWRVTGAWPEGGRQVLVGQDLARRLHLGPGATLAARPDGGDPQQLQVVGILDSGGPEDGWVVAPLALVQGWTGLAGQAERVEVSALTTPDTELARVAARDPGALSAVAFETWYCTAFAGSIAYQIEEAIPGSSARPLQEISRAESSILGRVQAVVAVLAALGLLLAGLGISNLMQAKVQERQRELGLLRSLGASRAAVAALFLAEGLLEGALGGLAGYGLGVTLAWWIGRAAFGLAVAPQAAVLPLVLILATLVTLGGSISALGFLLRLQPARVLRQL